jgi:hypothetical protein
MPHMLRHACPVALAALVTGVLCCPGGGSAFAQPASRAKQPASKSSTPTVPAARTPGKPGAGPGPVEFAEEPFKLESVGLAIRIPVGATADRSQTGDQVTAVIQGKDHTWFMNVQVRQPQRIDAPNAGDAAGPKGVKPGAPGTLTTSDVAQKAYELLVGSVGVLDSEGHVVSSKATTISREHDLKIGGLDAERFYVGLPADRDQPAIVRGYTILSVGGGRFVSFELFTGQADFAKNRPIYETTIATATFVDPVLVEAARGAALEAGQRVLGQLGPEDYRAIIGADNDKEKNARWERLYRPHASGADSDATEVAYRRVRTWMGRRGELDPSRDRTRWSAADKAEGYLLQIDARFLDSNYARSGAYADSQGIYFLSLDRQEETWTLRMTQHNGKAKATYSETGARTGQTMSINRSKPSESPIMVKPVVPQQGYLSQLEMFILPQLLARAGTPLDYGFYVYQPAREKIGYRQESLEPEGGSLGRWKYTTKLGEDEPSQEGVYDKEGWLIRLTLPDGTVQEPTTLDKLDRLWRSKNLPVGSN